MSTTDLDPIRQFMFAAHQAGYGNPSANIADSDDGGHIITFTDGEWSYRDHYYGGQPYAGQEVIYKSGRPVWSMQYRGWVNDAATPVAEVYGFLQEALRSATAEHPHRGPSKLTKNGYQYQNDWEGDTANFSGSETITHDGREVYQALYFGGLVDQYTLSANSQVLFKD